LPRNIARLNALVKIRKLIEDQCRVKLATLREKEYMAKEKLYHLQMEQRWSQDQLQKDKSDIAPDEKVNTWSYLSYLDTLSQRALHQTKIIKELQLEIEGARQELLDASKSRKMIEKLLNREINHNRQNMAIQERKNLDEIAATRFIRNNIQ